MQRRSVRTDRHRAACASGLLVVAGAILAMALVVGFTWGALLLGLAAGGLLAWLLAEFAFGERRGDEERPLAERWADGQPFGRTATQKRDGRTLREAEALEREEAEADRRRLEERRRREPDHSGEQGPPPTVPFP